MSGIPFGRASFLSAAVVAASLVLATLGAAPASADFIYTSQNRYVKAIAPSNYPGTVTQTFQASNFDPFNATANASYNEGVIFAHAVAKQNSILTPAMISAVGYGEASGHGMMGSVAAEAEYRFSVYFTVTEAVPFTLSMSSAMSTVYFDGPGLSLTTPGYGDPGWQLPLFATRTLVAGQYHVSVDSRIMAYGSDNADAFDFQLNARQSSLLGDTDRDGTVNALDIDLFVSPLTAGAYLTQADINRDNLVNAEDISGFVTCLVNGGCGQITEGAGLAPIPEPSTLLALAASCLCLKRCR